MRCRPACENHRRRSAVGARDRSGASCHGAGAQAPGIRDNTIGSIADYVLDGIGWVPPAMPIVAGKFAGVRRLEVDAGRTALLALRSVLILCRRLADLRLRGSASDCHTEASHA